MRAALLFTVALGACLPGGQAETSAFSPAVRPPGITEVSVACDKPAARWRIEVATDSWAGGAVLVWTADGAYAERHDGFQSVAAGVAGDRDLLRVDVGIVRDFRPAGNGTSAFSCGQPLSAVVWVVDLEGEVSDCRYFGGSPRTVGTLKGVPEVCRSAAWATDTDADTDTASDTDVDTDVDTGGDTGLDTDL